MAATKNTAKYVHHIYTYLRPLHRSDNVYILRMPIVKCALCLITQHGGGVNGIETERDKTNIEMSCIPNTESCHWGYSSSFRVASNRFFNLETRVVRYKCLWDTLAVSSVEKGRVYTNCLVVNSNQEIFQFRMFWCYEYCILLLYIFITWVNVISSYF